MPPESPIPRARKEDVRPLERTAQLLDNLWTEVQEQETRPEGQDQIGLMNLNQLVGYAGLWTEVQ